MAFLLAELRLLIMLCQGNNEVVIKALQGQDESGKGMGVKLTFQTVMPALYDDSLMTSEPRIRARLLELLIGKAMASRRMCLLLDQCFALFSDVC